MRYRKNPRAWSPAAVGLLVAAAFATGAHAASPADAPAVTAERLCSNDWVERKTVRRELWRMQDQAAKTSLAGHLADEVENAPDLRDSLRLLLSARSLDAQVALDSCRDLMDRREVPLELRRLVAQLMAQDAAAAAPARREMATVAHELMAIVDDAEANAIGLRILGVCEPAEAWPHIAEALASDDHQRRKNAAAALSEHAHEQAWELLPGLIADPSYSIRQDAVEALCLHGAQPGAGDVVRGVLESETDAAICSRAFEAAEKLPAAEGAALMIDRFDAEAGCGPSHRFAILGGLRRMLRASPDLAGVREFLQGVVADPREPSEAGYAAAALGDVALAESLGGFATIDGLIALTSKSLESKETRYAAIAALGRLEDAKALARLEVLLGRVEEDDDLILHMMQTLHAAGGGRAGMASFCAGQYTAESENPEIRRAAVTMLSQHGSDDKAGRRLQALLSDADAAIAALAHAGLVRLAGEDLGTDPAAWNEVVAALPAQSDQTGGEVAPASEVPHDHDKGES